MDTSSYGGKKLEKIAEVMSNDPNEPKMNLKVFGQVERFVSITPNMLHLRGIAGERLKGTIFIIPEDKYPFNVQSVEATPGKFKLTLQEVKEGSKNGYALSVENLKTEAGSYNDTVVLKTDSPIRAELQVRVYVYLQPPQPSKGEKR